MKKLFLINIKNFLLNHSKKFNMWFEGGLLSVNFSQIIINFIFQRVFKINDDVRWPVHFTSKVIGANKIQIGKKVALSFSVSGGCYIQGLNGIILGDHTIFAPGVKIISANHDIENNYKTKPGRPIRIGSHCWIGANAVILPEVELGDNIVIGAGAIVTKNFPSNVIIAGNPAKIIKNLEKN